MKIHSINIQNINKNYNLQYANVPFLLPKPIQQDTVSFSGGAKKLENPNDWSNRVSYSVCQQVGKESKQGLDMLLDSLKYNLKDLISSEQNPEAPIAPNGIYGRIKEPKSMMEKAEIRKLYTKKEIASMGDIVGCRIILSHSTKKDFNEVFMALGEMVKNGKLKIKEIENYRMTRAQSFVSSKTLDKLEDICHSQGLNPSRTGQTIPNGYTAVHLTVELPNGQPAEIQIMSKEMEKVKDIEDFYYKIRCGKHLAPKYKTIETVMKNKMSKLTDFQKETLNMYIKDSYAQAFELSVNPPDNISGKTNFIPFPYSLPQELSFVELQKMKERCDKIARE